MFTHSLHGFKTSITNADISIHFYSYPLTFLQYYSYLCNTPPLFPAEKPGNPGKVRKSLVNSDFKLEKSVKKENYAVSYNIGLKSEFTSLFRT